jgi:hypothetical protein
MKVSIRTLAPALVLLAACAGTATELRTVQSGCADVYGAIACTRATPVVSGAVTGPGANTSLAVAERAPEEIEISRPLASPGLRIPIGVEGFGPGVLEGVCVPEVGMLALLAAVMQNDQPSDGTMIIGFYQGSPVFFEPLIARDLLMRRQSSEQQMPTVSSLSGGVRYPALVCAEYDAPVGAYRFVFTGS